MATPALLFDLDGTLIDSARDIARALTIVSEARGGQAISPEVVRPLVSLGAETLVSVALGPVAGDATTDLADFRHVLSALPADPAIVYPGVAAALASLAAAGHPMAIVTNKPEGLARLALQGVGLDHHFSVIVGGDTAARPKPDPAPVLHALQLLGHAAADALLIGDSAVDAGAAGNCGIPFLLFEGGYGESIADADIAARFARFDRLPPTIMSLMQGGAGADQQASPKDLAKPLPNPIGRGGREMRHQRRRESPR